MEISKFNGASVLIKKPKPKPASKKSCSLGDIILVYTKSPWSDVR